jgi:hypothetical protein
MTMGNAARKARKKTGVKFVKEPKTPTRRYLTREEIQIKKARAKAAEKRQQAMAERLGKALFRGKENAKGVEFK